ncbi:MAG: S8 family serine peptidase [Pyrinomonadaceae bacterium]
MIMPNRSRLIVLSIVAICSVAAALEYGRTSFAYSEPSLVKTVIRAAGGNPIFTNAATAGVVEPSSKIAPKIMADTQDGAQTSVVIFLAEQADVSAAYSMEDQDARGWYVYNTLTQHAERTQAGLKAFLQERGVTFQSFWAANMLVADADLTLVRQLADRPDVARIDPNSAARWIEDPIIADEHPSTEKTDSPDAIEWGVSNVNAPAVWAMGFRGQGMVVGGLDTGIRWTHNVLKAKYRGWNGTTADHNYNWHDSIHTGGGDCGFNTIAPCDDNGHGTHTVGTMVGDDGATNQVGVAPDAKWMGCRNMNVGDGTPATYTECFQFTIAPTDSSGNNPDPSKRPHVLNNSWGCPASEGCTTRAELESIVNNTQASGIFVEVSAGNAGPGCSTVLDAPAIYAEAFSTGAISSTNALASFSSRGPSTYYNPALLKPNVSAPGVNVRSATRSSDTAYTSLSGTSMAGPHVAAVVALLWSARPQLVRNIAATKTLLQNTANPNVTLTPQTCGGTPSTSIPNNSFGYGRVDVLAAVNAAGGGTPTPTATPTPVPTCRTCSRYTSTGRL